MFFLSKLNPNSDEQTMTNEDEITVPEFITTFFKLTRKHVDSEKLPLMQETVNFKFNFLFNLFNLDLDYRVNISRSEKKFISDFIKNKPFIVAECDKNVGISIMSNEIYDEFVLDHLNDASVYKKLDTNPLDSTVESIKIVLNNLLVAKQIDKRIFKNLIVTNPKLGKFRLLTKVHKEKLSHRPIINSRDHPTSNMCLLLNLILQPFVQKCESFLLDSQNLIQDTVNLNIPDNYRLTVADFVSLYTNINQDHALTVISDFISSNFNSEYISALAFHEILRLVLKYNIFCYKGKNVITYLIQILGIAMGSICGPAIANIYIYCLEKNFLTIHKPFYYKRFIDDLFLITNPNFDISLLNTAFGYLKLNAVTAETVNFLDLNIYLCKFAGRLKFSLYIKPTNTFSYLLTQSNHPKFIFDNIPKSLFFRIRRICSSFSDYLYFSRILIKQLVSRGYDFHTICKVSRMVANLDRNSIIAYKNKDTPFAVNKIFFKLSYNFNYLNLEKTFMNSYNNINSVKFLENRKLKLIFNMQPNLSSIFIHNSKPIIPKKFYYKPCSNPICEICPYHSSVSTLFLKNFRLPILSFCNSVNVIYIIICEMCLKYYIGQTANFKRRFKQHINSCIAFNNSNCKCVREHFNSAFHNYSKHLKFIIFRVDIEDKKLRVNIENQLIYFFHTSKIPILNDFIPNFQLYKKQLPHIF